MTLDKVKSNQVVEIKHIDGGWGTRQRLNQLGIYAGGRVRIKRSSAFGGPLIIAFNNSEVAIGRGLAARIQIEIHDAAHSEL